MNTYLVGGAVRDQLLGLPVKDRDWVVTGADADTLAAAGLRPVGRDFPVFIHPDTGEEYALARTERKHGHGYKGFHVYADASVTLEEDLLRRDLTINAMALDSNGQLIDPYGGRQDLAQRLLRHVSPAFVEDPLRVLRVARFAARFATLGFRVAETTLTLMRQLSDSGELTHLTQERVWQEFERALGCDQPWVFLQVLKDAHALEPLLPEFSTLDINTLTAPFTRLKQCDATAESAFALLCLCRFTPEHQPEIITLCQRLKAPRRFQELALLACTQLPQLHHFNTLSAETRLTLMQRLKLLRQPDALPTYLHLLAAYYPQHDPQTGTRIKDLLERLLRISPKPLMATGLSGQALGKALHQQQLACCAD